MTKDTFDDEGNSSPSNKVMSITTPFYDLSKPQGALGIMILQYKLRELGKMIDHVSFQWFLYYIYSTQTKVFPHTTSYFPLKTQHLTPIREATLYSPKSNIPTLRLSLVSSYT